MATADDIAEGFYRYPDLKAKKYVSSRSDLHDKQKKLGFPLPEDKRRLLQAAQVKKAPGGAK